MVRRKGVSPVSNTTKKLWEPRKEQGSDITWQPVERHFKDEMGRPRTYDLFGFADYLYMEDRALVAVQIGGPGTHKAHREKILAEPRARQWLGCGNRIELITWSKRGGTAKVWVPRVEEITLAEFEL
jgi:hypothetical protein